MPVLLSLRQALQAQGGRMALCGLRTSVREVFVIAGLARTLNGHATEQEAIDKNYAIHFPWIDRIFGTYYSPKDRWPQSYGLAGEELSPSFIGQTIRPFVGK